MQVIRIFGSALEPDVYVGIDNESPVECHRFYLNGDMHPFFKRCAGEKVLVCCCGFSVYHGDFLKEISGFTVDVELAGLFGEFNIVFTFFEIECC